MLVCDLIWHLEEMDECGGMIDWLDTFDARASLKGPWNSCERADWLLWLAEELGVDAEWSKIGAEIVETVLPLWEACAHLVDERHSDAPRRAAEAARSGEATADAALDAHAAADAAGRLSFRMNSESHGGQRNHEIDAVNRASCAASAAAYAAKDAAFAARLATRADETQRKAHIAIVRAHIAWSDIAEVLGEAVEVPS